jgi:FAD/FMN-containing dehydrogenase/Fe-S oxidoreductase
MLVHIAPSSSDAMQDAAAGRRASASWWGDASALEAELKKKIRGEVRFDAGSRALYSTDASNYRQPPIGVVIPRDLDDVLAAAGACRQFGAPLLNRGGGTSLAGQCCNVAVVLDMSKYLHKVLEIDPLRRFARVEPGCVLDDLRRAANPFGLTFGPDPATHDRCTLGGMAGNNSCGMHAQMAGRTSDNIHELVVLTYDGHQMRVGATPEHELQAHMRESGRVGEIYRALHALSVRYADLIRRRYPHIPRRISGYNLDDLLPEKGFQVARALVGSEGTCVTILEVVADLVYNPPKRALLVIGYPDVFEAADHIPQVVAHQPIGCEGLDLRLAEFMRKKGVNVSERALLPDGGGWLMVEFGGDTREEAEGKARALMDELKKEPTQPAMRLYDDPAQAKLLWEVRESALGATAFVPGEPDAWPGWEDSAVPPEKTGEYLRDLKRLFRKHGLDEPALYGHFGQGCIHCRVPFELTTAEGLRQYRAFMDNATDLAVAYGGSLSGEHGDGQSRAEYLSKMFGPELVQAFREFKAIWDPDGKMNPGKVVNPHSADQDLRLGATYNPPRPETHFSFPEDRHNFARSALRCVGAGKCRREKDGVMCPSYMVTREEMHSTRGRARMLFEMLEGELIESGWRSPEVRDALDLCLSCKGCKSECPVNVDMATYKAEFLSHHYAGRLRPRHMYASGLIRLWCEMASSMPGTANFFTQTPGLSAIVKWAAGYHQRRRIPPFAARTFKESLRGRRPANPGGPRVILWADTFNDHFTPTVGLAAVDVLERAGFQVVVPKQNVCCGRPLYDYGMLDTARKWLLATLGALKPEIQTGTPVIVLEPGCLSVFRDEMPNLLHGNQDAARLKESVFSLGEFLANRDDYQPPKLNGKALVHRHCHDQAVLHWEDEVKLLHKTGLDVTVLDSGCCGMAGGFGFESEHHDISVACGERVLLPSVRTADANALIVADGFSCREQIRQETQRRALHLSQALKIAYETGPSGPGDIQAVERRLATPTAVPSAPLGLMLGAAAVAGALYWWKRSRS